MTPIYTFHAVRTVADLPSRYTSETISAPTPGAPYAIDASARQERLPCMGIEVQGAIADACLAGVVDPQHGGHRAPCPLLSAGCAGMCVCGAPSEWPPVEAGDSACSYALRMPLPPDGTAMVTDRPDVDSIAAMAITLLRRLSLIAPEADTAARDDLRNQNFPIVAEAAHGAALARIELIRSRDQFRPGAVWAPRPIPTVARTWPTTDAPVSETESLAPVGVICSPARNQPQLPMAERIAVMACWLLWADSFGGITPYGLGRTPAEGDARRTEREDAARRIYEACGITRSAFAGGRWPGEAWDPYVDAHDVLHDARERAVQGRLALARAVDSGEVRIRMTYRVEIGMLDMFGHDIDTDPTSRGWSHQYDVTDAQDGGVRPYSVEKGSRGVAVVESAHIGALGLGYCVAPIVCARFPAPEGEPYKVTIAAWVPSAVDFHALCARLNSDEVLAHPVPLIAAAAVAANPWGGNLASGILGSPKGAGTHIPWPDVVRMLREHVR